MKFLFLITGIGFVAALSGVAQGSERSASPGRSPAVGATTGSAVYEKWCATCHSDGPRMPGTLALEVKYGDKARSVLTNRTDLSPQVITYFVRNGVGPMPRFRKTEITDAELAQLSEFLSVKPK
ncbi:c-type cytochrome [Tsuneonella sp. HG222]